MTSFALGAAALSWILAQPNLAKPPTVPLQKPVRTLSAEGAPAQPEKQPAKPLTSATKSRREYFVSWGYNGDFYTKSDLHIEQPSLGNDFALEGVQARDSKPWTMIFGHSLFVPQYNVRAGIFFNERWGVELALDHMKWIVRQDQDVRMTGTLNGTEGNSTVTLTTDVLRYKLNNGANPVFVNVVRRGGLRGVRERTGAVSWLAKAGGGFAMPHTENVLFGQPNEKGFQFFHGVDMDVAAAVRVTLPKRLYFEFEEKVLYAR